MAIALKTALFVVFLGTCSIVLSQSFAVHNGDSRYTPRWEDLDSRPLPEWYDRAKIGIFVHWGVYSVPSFFSEWFWGFMESESSIREFMETNYRPGFSYQEFAPMFTAEFFNPYDWSALFQNSGAKYVVLTSKHHDGYTLFPSNQTFSWNSVDVGPHRDIVKELGAAVRARGLEYGLYYSLLEWYNPMYIKDQLLGSCDYVENKVLPDLKQLVTTYNPSILWVDGEWEASAEYWKSKEFLTWLYNESPVKDRVVVNDRWGGGMRCHHGDFYTCDDRYDPGNLQKHKWENAFTIDTRSWGYRRNLDLTQVLTSGDVIKRVIRTISCGGNALINVGPTKEGTIPLYFQERLKDLGDWLNVNGEAIYDTSPWLFQNDTWAGNVWYTCKKMKFNPYNPIGYPDVSDKITAIYAIFWDWPVDNVLELLRISRQLHIGFKKVEMLGNYSEQLELNWKISNGVASIQLPNKAAVTTRFAWVLKFFEPDKNVKDVKDNLNK